MKLRTISSLPSDSQITRSILLQYRYDELSTQRLLSVASKAAPKVCADGYRSLTDCDRCVACPCRDPRLYYP